MSMPKEWEQKLAEHWDKAIADRPHFVDLITRQTEDQVVRRLSDCYKHVREQDEKKTTAIKDLLELEFIEAMKAYSRGNLDRCTEKLYDAVTVIMRAVRLVERAEERRARGRSRT